MRLRGYPSRRYRSSLVIVRSASAVVSVAASKASAIRPRFTVRGPCGQYDSMRRGDEQILVGCTASRLGQQAADVGIELSKDASAGYVKGSGDQPQISFDDVRSAEAKPPPLRSPAWSAATSAGQPRGCSGRGEKLFVGVSQESLISRGEAFLSRPQLI